MVESFDVVIVGARCAGATLAALLARSGVSVAVLEQTTFPRETLSSHLVQADSLTFLDRLGVIDRIRATGARLMRHADTRLADLRIRAPFPQRPGDLGAAAVIRRHLLDPILADAAVAAGADVRMATKVTGLLHASGRVAGVRALHDGSELRLRARLVVGADGRTSTVARLCGAREYNVTHSERPYHWTFFEGAAPSSDDTLLFHRWGDRMVWGGPADSSLFLLGVSPDAHDRDQMRRDAEPLLMRYVRSCEPAASALADARRATKIYGIVRFKGYFREAFGPGWALIGDAGHFKDPAAGRGIGDAFLQSDALAPAIVAAIDGSGPPLERALARWSQWRDEKFIGHHWMSAALGGAGELPRSGVELVRRLHARGMTDSYLDLFSHRSSYYEVFTLRRLAAATARVMLGRDADRRALASATRALLLQEIDRRWLRRRPRYATAPVAADERPAALAPRVRPARG